MKKAFLGFFPIYLAVCFYTLFRYDMLASVLGRMLLCFLSAIILMSLVFVLAKRKSRYDYIDAGWGLAFIVIAWTGFLLQNGAIFKFDTQLLVCVLVSIWGARLFLHIGGRLRRTTIQDRRYTELMSTWPDQKALRVYLKLFVVQALLALLVSIPVVHVTLSADSTWNSWTSLGLVVWIAGFIFESVGDWQLKKFLASPASKGKLMTKGLWSITRHPNYFGEITMWWGLALISLGTAHGWVGLGGAVFITYLITFISGVPLAEKSTASKQGWKAYAAKTPVLIPFMHRPQ